MLEKVMKKFIDRVIIELDKEDNKEKLDKQIINPLLSNFSYRLFPYISLLFIMYSFNIILIISILILILNNK
jgi:hypothetical protein